MARIGRISLRGALRLASWTVFGTLGCLAISVAFNWIAFRNLGGAALRQGLISATVLPIILAGPLFLYLTLKLRELSIVNRKLHDLASTDTLTACLNRGAFSTLVGGWLDSHLAGATAAQSGALLLPGATETSALAIAERIRANVAQSQFRPFGKPCALTVSVGCASFEKPESFAKLFRIADERLYMAKRAGRNRVVAAHLPEQGARQLHALH